MKDELLEPLKYYNSFLKDEHLKNVEQFFEELVKRSKVNVEENRKSVAEYKKKQGEIADFEKKLKKFNIFKILCIVGISIFAIFAIINFVNLAKYKELVAKRILMLIVFIGAIAGAIFALVSKILPTIKNDKEEKGKIEKIANNIKEECYKQLEPLNRLYNSDDTRQIIMKTLPDIVIDKNFDIKRFEYLNAKYGIIDNKNVNESCLRVLTGEIVGNPYLIVKNLKHTLGTYTYTGSLTISWETYHYDSNGNRITEHHTETLRASLTKPKPYYNEYTELIYGNEAAPDLSFSRQAKHVEKNSEKQIEKMVKKGSKDLVKLSREAIKNGSDYTLLGNDEFEVLFGGTNRDNDIQFRLLYTPLAQKNTLDLLKNSIYGDDFYFEKSQKLNFVINENSANWNLDTFGGNFKNFDIDDAQINFRKFNVQYFDHFYFQLAPILCVPLYQQYKPSEYIYKHNFKRNYTSYQSEVMANSFGSRYLAHSETATRTIYKTQLASTNDGTDNLNVAAYSYKTIDRTDYIPVYGGDGQYHDVPVNWVEYIPLTKYSTMKIMDTELTDYDFGTIRYKDEFNQFMNNHEINSFLYEHGMFGFIVNPNRMNDEIKNDFYASINNIFK